MTQTYLSDEYKLHIDHILRENNSCFQISWDFYVRFDDTLISGKLFRIKSVPFVIQNNKIYVFAVRKVENRFFVKSEEGYVDFETFIVNNAVKIREELFRRNCTPVFSPALEEIINLRKKAEAFQDTGLQKTDCYNKMLVRLAPDLKEKFADYEFLFGLKFLDFAKIISKQVAKENCDPLTRFKAYFYCTCYKLIVATIVRDTESKILDPDLKKQAEKYSYPVPKLINSLRDNSFLSGLIPLPTEELRKKFSEYKNFINALKEKRIISETDFWRFVYHRMELFLKEVFPDFPVIKTSEEIKVGRLLTEEISNSIVRARDFDKKSVKIV